MSQASTLSPVEEVIEFFARGPSRQETAAFRRSGVAQGRIRELLHKNATGAVTQEEHRALDQMVLLDDIVALVRAHVGDQQGRSGSAQV